MFDVERLVEGIHDYIGRAVAPLAARFEALSDEVRALADRQPAKGEPGDPGKSVTAAEVLPELEAAVIERAMEVLANIETPQPGKDGESVTLDDVRPLIESKQSEWALDFERRAQDLLQRAIERIPVPRDGRDGDDSDPDTVAAKVIEKLDLKGTRTDIKKMCREMAAVAVAEIPTPRDGVDGAPGRDGIDGRDGEPGTDGAPGRDGVDGKDAPPITDEQIDAMVEKRLATRVAEWALDFEKRAQSTLEKAIDRMPRPKDGVDGLSLEDFDAVIEADGRTVVLSLIRDGKAIERRLKFDTVLYRDVWKDQQYEKGDAVTWGGSMWIALRDNKTKPGQFNKDWRLAVKRGQAGRA